MVSVIIPNYNHSRYLKQRIDSILAQTYRDFELIILDDHSTDNSRSVIESYRNEPSVSHIIYNQQNSGSVFRQWKKGIALAKGEYIWIAESDDYAEPELLAELVALMEENEDIFIAHVNAKLIDENGTWQGKTLKNIDDGEGNQKFGLPRLIRNGEEELRASLSFCSSITNASGVLFRAAPLKSIDLDFSKYRYAGDWAVYVMLATKGSVAFLNKELSNFRFHSNNTSKKARKDLGIFKEHMEIILFYADWLKRNGGSLDAYAPHLRFKLFEVFKYLPLYKALHLQWKFFRNAPSLYFLVTMAQIKHMWSKRINK